ncbi:hypothetical protein [Cerasicoccus frondis]|uniref:hypothetical protein n=1 Tax=Cerasicoccus frondis TaxID=490090 RepID=UPI0028529300|nr:hypothetical protein [Cerasicoccus frondis]
MMEKHALEPILHIRFTNDFTVVQVEGDIEDSSSFSVTLMTAIRSLGSGSDALGLGAVTALRGLNCGEGFQLILDESGHNLKKYSGVTAWGDFCASPMVANFFPVIPAREDLAGWIDNLSGVRWRGLRTQADDQWGHYHRDQDDEAALSQFSLAVLQLDLLVRSLELPRRQLKISFTGWTLWVAVNEDSDFLLVLTDASLSPSAEATLERCLSFFCWPL